MPNEVNFIKNTDSKISENILDHSKLHNSIAPADMVKDNSCYDVFENNKAKHSEANKLNKSAPSYENNDILLTAKNMTR